MLLKNLYILYYFYIYRTKQYFNLYINFYYYFCGGQIGSDRGLRLRPPLPSPQIKLFLRKEG